MQTARCQTQKSTTPTELAAPARADAGSNLNGLARSTPKSWIGWAALVVGIGALAASITLTSTPAGSNDQNLWMALGLVTWTGAPSRG